MKKKATMLAMLAAAMMSDPSVRDLFCGSNIEPKPKKDPNSPISQDKLAKAEEKRKRKSAKMKQDAEKSGKT